MINIGSLTSEIDVAQLCLYTFFVFFVGLVFYLHRENMREGHPLVTDHVRHAPRADLPYAPKQKVFLLPHGGEVAIPRREATPEFGADDRLFRGEALQVSGNLLASGVGPAAWADRADVPDLTMEDGRPRILPLRAAPDFGVSHEDPDPRGYPVLDADGVVAGTVADIWIDRPEMLARYFEVRLNAGTRTVLIPVPMADVSARRGVVRVGALLAAQFEGIPGTKSPDQVTLREEDQIQAYVGAGVLYAKPSRLGPVL